MALPQLDLHLLGPVWCCVLPVSAISRPNHPFQIPLYVLVVLLVDIVPHLEIANHIKQHR